MPIFFSLMISCFTVVLAQPSQTSRVLTQTELLFETNQSRKVQATGRWELVVSDSVGEVGRANAEIGVFSVNGYSVGAVWQAENESIPYVSHGFAMGKHIEISKVVINHTTYSLEVQVDSADRLVGKAKDSGGKEFSAELTRQSKETNFEFVSLHVGMDAPPREISGKMYYRNPQNKVAAVKVAHSAVKQNRIFFYTSWNDVGSSGALLGWKFPLSTSFTGQYTCVLTTFGEEGSELISGKGEGVIHQEDPFIVSISGEADNCSLTFVESKKTS